MMNFKNRLNVDSAVFGQNIIHDFPVVTWKDRIWAAWKVLNGEAGVVLVRIDPKKFYKASTKKSKKETTKQICNMTFIERLYLIFDSLPSGTDKLESYDKEFFVQAIIDLIESEGWKHG
jgi:hypothetical protein